MTDWHGHGNSWGGDAPVFDWDWPEDEDGGPDKSYGLPNVWITVQEWEPSPGHTGRNCIWNYTPEGDDDGWEALRYGGAYYREGMSCDPDGPHNEHEKRLLCFQAAELLYLHASRKGNPIGDLNLGYVYSYDRCEGKYWDRSLADDTPVTAESIMERIVAALAGERPDFDHEAHAFKHYQMAAEAGIAEACYKLGDMLRDGRGCEADLDEAYGWFSKAYEFGKEDAPVIWGSAALRLGRAHEEGEGCTQSFEEALTWYERATTGLSIAVRGGEDWYRGALRQAESGFARAHQELDGSY